MVSARSGRTEVTDILLTGENIDPDIQENVRISSCAIHVSTFCTPSLVAAPITPLSERCVYVLVTLSAGSCVALLLVHDVCMYIHFCFISSTVMIGHRMVSSLLLC